MLLISLCLAALLALAFFESKEAVNREGYEIRFGIIEEDQAGEYDIFYETTTIPLIYQETGFIWGYSIYPPDRKAYTTYEVLSLPAPPKHIEFSVPIEKMDGGRIIRTGGVERRDHSISIFRFSYGDPLGQWKLQVYVNEELIRTIRFRVVRS